MDLHEAAISISTGHPKHAPRSLSRLLELVASGTQVNTLKDGRSALSLLLFNTKERVLMFYGPESLTTASDLIRSAASALISAGADPWSGSPSAWSQETLWSPVELLRLRAAHSAAVSEVPSPASRGETDLHAILRRPDHTLSAIFFDDQVEMIRPEWLNALDDAGATPLHALWRTASPDEAMLTSQITENLMEMGASVDLPDSAGRTVIDLIFSNKAALACMAEGGASLPETLQAAQAAALNERLDQATASSPPRRTAGRL